VAGEKQINLKQQFLMQYPHTMVLNVIDVAYKNFSKLTSPWTGKSP
jgi:hypothetical protein